MSSNSISFKETGYFSKLVCDYLDEKAALSTFYKHFPTIENFKAQIQDKAKNYPNENRDLLTQSVTKQYEKLEKSEKYKANIEALQSENTFTITTGHQLNLFTGPLYFLFKIISTINLTEELKTNYPTYHFVPIYWMATEDHDFLEINYFSLKGKKIAWNKKGAMANAYGAVGAFDTHGLDQVFKVLDEQLGLGANADYLRRLFKEGYVKHDNLANATRFIVNELFGKYGLVIVDANCRALKSMFVPVMAEELKNHTSYNEVMETSAALEKLDYGTQVTPREINLFYLSEHTRERIVKNETGGYDLVDKPKSWATYAKIEEELQQYPERFSPNVILRPVYQEVILPNLCYIGGGGELAYWFQLKSSFEALDITFPILLLRNSALLISSKQAKKQQALKVSFSELFLKQFQLINLKVRQISDIEIDFTAQQNTLKDQFKGLRQLAAQTDQSFINAVNAQEKKQLKGLENLEKRLLKAQRIKLKDQVARLVHLQRALFPQESLQERKANFSEFYLAYGDELISKLKQELHPLDFDFKGIIF